MRKSFLIGLAALLLALAFVTGCGKSAYVGTWIMSTGNGNIVIQSDKTGFINLTYSSPKHFTWEDTGTRIKMMPDSGRPQDMAFGEINSDDNMQLYKSETSTEPMMVLTRQK